MTPSPLDLGQDGLDIDLDKPSPSINIESADRFPASPWDQYNTDWKFDQPGEPSNPYTPSYGSFNSYGSHSVSWGGRENSDPLKMYDGDDFLMDEGNSSIRSLSATGRDDDYDPSQFENDIVVGDMDNVPQVSLTPAMDSFPQNTHSPSYSGAGSPSSPGSEGQRSRGSSVSSLHYQSPFGDSMQSSGKPPSPPALVIPDDGVRGLGLQQPQMQSNAHGLGVSINIVPSTPLDGLDAGNVGDRSRERFPPQSSNQQGGSSASNNDPQGWPGPSSHPPTPQYQTHSRSNSNSRNPSPSITPGNISVEFAPPQQSHFTQHRSPALSSTSSLHNSPVPRYAQLSSSESPRRRDEFLLPDSNPHPGEIRPRASSHGSSSGIGALGLGTLNLQDPNRPQLHTMASAPPQPNQHHYGGLLHPQTALDGSFLSPGVGGSQLRRSKSDAAGHRRGVKSEDFHGNFNDLLAGQPTDFFNSQHGQQMEFLTPPSNQGRRGHGRHASLGNSPMMHGSSHNYGHHSHRTSPYPSPHASPSGMRVPLPDIGGSSSGLGLNVFDTYGASGMGGPQDVKPGMIGSPGMMGGMPLPGGMGLDAANPPKKLVTTKATHDASVSRRKNDAVYACPVPGCGSTFTRSFNLKGHMRSHMELRPFKCKWPGCGKGFARQHDCKRHESLHLNVRPYTCAGCKKTFARMDALNRHLKSEGGADCAGVQQEYDVNGNGNGSNGNGGQGPGGGGYGSRGERNGNGDMDGGLIM